MSGASIAAEIDAALAEVAGEVGDGDFLVTISTSGSPITSPTAEHPDASPASPVLGAPTQQTFNAMQITERVRERKNSSVGDGERVYSLGAPVNQPAPTVNDKMVISGVSWNITEVMPVDYAGVALSYEVTVKN